MACKYIFNNIIYSSKEEFIKEVLEKDFLNQPKTLRVQELQQPDFLKFIRKDKDYLKSQGLTDKEVNFLNLLFGDTEKWVGFFIKSLIQNAAKDGYSKIWLPSGNTSAKVEGHTTLEEFKKQKEDRIKELEKQIINKINYLNEENNINHSIYEVDSVNWENKTINFKNNLNGVIKKAGLNAYYVYDTKIKGKSIFYLKSFSKDYTQETIKEGLQKTIDSKNENKKTITDTLNNEISVLQKEINQLKQELERVETEGFGALKPIYNFYENTVTNILNKTYGKENVKQITDEYGNTWNEITLTPKMSETIRLNAPKGKIEYVGDLAIEEKIAEEAYNSKDEKVPTTLIGKFIQSIRNMLRNLYKEKDNISRLIRDLNQGRFKEKFGEIPSVSLENEELSYFDEVGDYKVKYQQNNKEGIIASEKTIRDLAARISDRIGIPYKIESDRTKQYKGKIENGTAYINLAYATLDTVPHEVLAHPIIRALRNKSKKSIDSEIDKMIEMGIIKKQC
jgi:hypothetical protein